MNLTVIIGRLLGYDDVTQIEGWRPSFGASWAHSSPLLLVFGLLAAAGLSAWFYLRMQPRGRTSLRIGLCLARGLVLGVLLTILADPILEITLVRHPLPTLWVALDGSESMGIADELPAPIREATAAAVHWSSKSNDAGDQPTRADYIRSFLTNSQTAWLKKLEDRFRVRTFVVSTDRGVETLDQEQSAPLSGWKPHGHVTALGDGLEELARRQAGDNLAGVILFSDFDQNAGAAPVSAARRLGAPLFTVGVGPESAVDLAVDLSAPPTMKKAEGSTFVVTIRQRELENTPVTVRVFAEPTSGTVTTDQPQIFVGERSLTLTAATQSVEFPFNPEQTGRFTFVAEVNVVPGETITQNNRSARDVRIIDDFLRLLYIEYEPTWEWRFVKEVFHRDKLVGMRGFRTFLRSADPVVRETNELFVSSLTLPRSEFFESDVIFLGDLPASALSTRFCEMTKEFVEQFGGGLVVLGGPRFGPGQLAETPMADLLPVVVDRDGRRRDERDFRMQLTPLAGQYDFMRLGQTDSESARAWGTLGKLPWYQPVLRVDPRATVLAEHPTDLCRDGKSKQPLIAVRPYGRGEVVYVGFNELWRLRRLHGEEYYRQFWGQLIHRLGLSHALGDQKRFVVRTDRQQYRNGDDAVITVEAYDKDFQPLQEADVPDRRLEAEHVWPQPDEQGRRSSNLSITQIRPGVFGTKLPLRNDGEHRLRVTDPVTGTPSEIRFNVSDVSVERRNPVRNVALQQSLASETGGRSYDLTTAHQFLDDFQPPRPTERTIEIFPLWNTWLVFVLVMGLLLTEWTVRKAINLP